MKSIMEEASSVMKAVEKGWIQAGKPQEFTIKVFEEATKNFLGITTKPAKVAIFFEEKTAAPQSRYTTQTHSNKQQRPAHQKQSAAPHKPFERDTEQKTVQRKLEPSKTPTKPVHPSTLTDATSKHTDKQKSMDKDVWTPDMVTAAKGWMEGLLASLNKQQLTFSTEVKNYYLRINVTTPVIDDINQEKMLFRNSAYLIMQSLRNKFKKSFRGFKVIVSSSR